jgi:cytosine/adenosine deaminase-related metal-dependent hydrolase
MALDEFQKRYAAAVRPVAAVRARSGLAPPQAWALKGCVLTPEATLDPGWVVIEGSKIAAVESTPPLAVRCIDTGGVILPGLIDVHGHPCWNVLPPWEPPHNYRNRNVWRHSDIYQQVVNQPMMALTSGFTNDHVVRLLARYGEIRALVGGVTAIQGDNSGRYDEQFAPLLRHVDLGPFGTLNAAAMIDPLDPKDEKEFVDRNAIIQDITDHSITAFYAHVGEGTDAASRAELQALDDLGLLASATVIIHGTAFATPELDRIQEAKAKLVWSPQSELRLYGKTSLAAEARRRGIPIGLGADWLPTGSVSLLDEMQVARRMLEQQDEVIGPLELVEMVTSGAAQIADLADNLGRLMKGRPADVLVLQRHHDNGYESVCRSGRASVELVAVDGRLLYARDDWFTELAPNAKLSRDASEATGERYWVWGKLMRLDLGTPHDPAESVSPPVPRRLSAIRSQILELYPRAGPMFA